MQRKVRFAQYGVGKMGSLLIRYALQKGGELVAAFGHSPKQIGRDVGEVIGVGALGVRISDSADADKVLRETRPDICLIATRGSMAEMREPYSACARNSVNALAIGEEALWPWTTSPEITRELDALAKANGCTLSASGCPEVPWGTLVSTIAAASASINKILVTGILNLEDYGALQFLYDNHGVGLTLGEFEAKFGAHNGLGEVDGHFPCFPGDQNGWMCNYLGLTVVSQTARDVPITHGSDVWSGNLKKTIPAGNVIGARMVVTTETAEGITVEYDLAGKVYTSEDYDHYSITITGEPETTVVMNNPATPVFTCAIPVNRIPDVINAHPGFVTTEEFPRGRYLSKPLNEYVEKD